MDMTDYTLQLNVLTGVENEVLNDPIDNSEYNFPSKPILDYTHDDSTTQQIQIDENTI